MRVENHEIWLRFFVVHVMGSCDLTIRIGEYGVAIDQAQA